MKYFNALMATVLGDEDQRAAALEYLKEVDPEIWDQEEQRARNNCGGPTAVTSSRHAPWKCEVYHKINMRHADAQMVNVVGFVYNS